MNKDKVVWSVYWNKYIVFHIAQLPLINYAAIRWTR